ncbi:TAFII55 protein conserved region containing protein [Babesia divergens]|uniref:TAFII55 protein conserved region containing protein n=1 Tax=Babesia divergens TaxID=32595 RepID=A0AAD9GJJ6_BABDI|nr:TAFII55 protein conserved region containing protein [Babesia divergens]
MSDVEDSLAGSYADGQSDCVSIHPDGGSVVMDSDMVKDGHDDGTNRSDVTNSSSVVASEANTAVATTENGRGSKHLGFEDAMKGKLLARHGIFGAHELYEDLLFNKPAKGERHSSKRLQYVDNTSTRDFSDLGSLDKHCIIRFPEEIANIINNRTSNGEDVGVTIEPTGRYDYREYVVRVRGVPMELMGILVELPCHIEAHKTLDCDLLFKAADISQMMLVQERKEAEVTIENMRQNLWEWPDGITPPTKNIRKRKFKNFDLYSNEDVKEAEKEALILLKGLVRDSYHFEVKSAQEVFELVESYRNGNIKERIIGPDEDVYDYIKAVQQSDLGDDESEIMFNADFPGIMK